MNDRQLLEAAAKAAGYRVNGWVGERFYVVDPNRPDGSFDPFVWAPLTDDGDALRLAVKIGLSNPLCVAILHGRTNAYEFETPNHAEENHATDPYAATRRAIVRAAAEMWK